MKSNLIILILILLPLTLFSKPLSQKQARQFIEYLITDNAKITNFIDKSEIKKANRLGIKYEDTDKKFLISYDIDDEIKSKIKKNQLSYKIVIKNIGKNIGDEYSKIIFRIPQTHYHKAFIFKAQKFISPLSFYTKDWKRIESDHFIFVISDSSNFNPYCIDNMEKFFQKASHLLKLNNKQLKRIEAQKIYYYLCKNPREIKRVTGYQARGMFNIAYDAVVTTFNAHYHELMHLLINYKIGKLPLYTNPFLQEGFAVAIGGRGGKETNIILDLGLFLYKSKFIQYSSLLSRTDFYQYDASLSYPASGLYSYFLINKMGIENYLKLYLKYSGSQEEVNKMKISEEDLPPIPSWNNFIDNCPLKNAITFTESPPNAILIYDDKANKIHHDATKYYFQLQDTLLIKTKEKNYQSKKFEQIFKNQKYDGEKYLIIASTEEISIYNLFTNNLIASCVSSFSDSSIPVKNGFYQFSVDKDIFDENLKDVLFLISKE